MGINCENTLEIWVLINVFCCIWEPKYANNNEKHYSSTTQALTVCVRMVLLLWKLTRRSCSTQVRIALAGKRKMYANNSVSKRHARSWFSNTELYITVGVVNRWQHGAPGKVNVSVAI